MARQAVGAADAGSIGRDHTEAERPGVLVGGADVVAAHEAAVAVHHRRPVLVSVERVAETAPIAECQLVIAEREGHAETLRTSAGRRTSRTGETRTSARPLRLLAHA